ncbi:4-hydroxy-tetrahydrodipicolinate synthase [Pseudobacteriovorax antillogorgiicola]|uniref:4-hydroxy-tetrahydrodipicolinate synthase n=1 Tax=Pseudobacteriovorax antillogorgiicola TaxID=1513793 RepID=A0A1Y6BAG0_9BACT|nr:4-hydroxy-tetrahydrodipicolinate synthase [Pseudobacteriovorax antillogorgiicola]TCS59232.1 4-hydroxy-tetrahydrodipicolinate synthase [Pseudobacteriovorax antillogorgiicola]SME90300.1 4-hydroxy-tetrahydrodipicolinate synthase [Pseudobacteriovorax antillogorgiicola]
MNFSIKGVHTAIVTPFDKDGNLDWDSFEKLLDHQAKGKVDGVVISGTTGESPTLTVQEKLALIRKARAYLPESIQVMAGAGSNNTQASVEMAKLAVDAGADSLLVVTPPYNKPSLNGLKLHFSSIATATNHPICLYHVPGRTGQLLSAAELAELCAIEQVVAVKEASADISLFSRAERISQANYLSGDDFTFLGSLAVEGDGVISVVTNIYPQAFRVLYDAFKAGDNPKAARIHKALLPAIEVLFYESNPGPSKAILANKGLCQNYFRAPMVPVSQESYAHIMNVVEDTERALSDLGVEV